MSTRGWWDAIWRLFAGSADPGAGGRFIGEIVAQLLPDGRNLMLINAFGYIDPDGERWDVPAGAETDGASVPRAFWIAYPPFTGRYRKAAVVHDRYCQTRERDWQRTHKVFYDAMLTAGVDDVTAKLLYGAVYHMGPRWGGELERSPGAPAPLGSRSRTGPAPHDDQQQLEVMGRLESWIKRHNPTAEQIAKALDSGQIP
jgi:Protein of unknown function (DUF1353)